MSMVDLKMSKKEMKDEAQPSLANQNPYPWGARINLDTDELKKLGIDEKNLPKVGDEVAISAVGRVASVSEDETTNGYRCTVSIQIEQMDLGAEVSEDVAGDKASAAEASATEGKSIMHSTYRGR